MAAVHLIQPKWQRCWSAADRVESEPVSKHFEKKNSDFFKITLWLQARTHSKESVDTLFSKIQVRKLKIPSPFPPVLHMCFHFYVLVKHTHTGFSICEPLLILWGGIPVANNTGGASLDVLNRGATVATGCCRGCFNKGCPCACLIVGCWNCCGICGRRGSISWVGSKSSF